MMKRTGKILCCLLMLLIFLPTTVFADMGPKPSVQVQLKRLPEQVYYVTLLSKEESTGPYSWAPELTAPAAWMVENDIELGTRAWQAFQQYQDPDGFYFVQYFRRCTPEEPFLWNYRPPRTFKVAVWLPQSDTLLTSEVCESYAFHSYFSATASPESTQLTLRKSYPFFWELISLAARTLGTILLEVLIAFLFRLKGPVLKAILWVNVATQLLLNVGLNLANYHSGPLAFFLSTFWLELVVLVVEAVIYKKQFRKHGETRRGLWLLYAAVANGFSFAAGLVLAWCIPGIF